MEELKMKTKELCELKDTLVSWAKEACNQGMQNVSTHEMGEVTDMIKDLCEAEEKLAKACYYKSIVKAMKDEEEESERMGYRGGRMGYDNWRYSSGRFAPTGRGHYDPAGYMPGEEIESLMMAEGFGENPMQGMRGYSAGNRGGSSNGSNQNGSSGSSYNGSNGSNGSNGRMGYSGSERGHRYDRYNQARMGYHESKDATSKEHMDASAREYVVDIAESMKEIWKDADPAMRKEIKNKLVSLTSEMN